MSAKCPWCDEEAAYVEAWKAEIVEHCIITEDRGGHWHLHGPVENKDKMRQVVTMLENELGASKTQTQSKSKAKSVTPGNERKIIFKHSRAAGDALAFTSGVRDFKLLFPDIRINVDSNFPDFWKHNPYIDTTLKRDDPGVEWYAVGYPSIQTCNNGFLHFMQGFLLDMIAIADAHQRLPISLGEFCSAFANGECGDPDLSDKEKNPQGAKEPFISWREKYKNALGRGKGLCNEFHRQRPDIHLSEDEKKENVIKDAYGYEKYWVVAPGG